MIYEERLALHLLFKKKIWPLRVIDVIEQEIPESSYVRNVWWPFIAMAIVYVRTYIDMAKLSAQNLVRKYQSKPVTIRILIVHLLDLQGQSDSHLAFVRLTPITLLSIRPWYAQNTHGHGRFLRFAVVD